MNSKDIQPVYEADVIAARVKELGAEIRAAAGDGEVFLLGILKGSSVLLADLLRNIGGEVSYAFIDVVRDAPDQQMSDAIEIDFMSFTDIRNRNVYVLKDVVSTGIIENYLLAQLRLHSPASIQLVALLDRPDARTVDLKADYVLFSITGGIYAGFGLEHEGRFGNLPWIGRVG
jgi:hypoxanthine phosphoribosyltransferase